MTTTVAEARCQWVTLLMADGCDEAEIHQMLLDVLDAVEQTELEAAVLAALNAFNRQRSA